MVWCYFRVRWQVIEFVSVRVRLRGSAGVEAELGEDRSVGAEEEGRRTIEEAGAESETQGESEGA